MEINAEHIRGLKPVGDKLSFPIHWLSSHAYCEYQFFLQCIKGVETEPTTAMVEGIKEHKRLEDEFLEKAVPVDFDDALEISKSTTLVRRELRVRCGTHGIYGKIDEVQFTPTEIIVIDDKPGTRAWQSHQHQIYGYCLALKERIIAQDNRPIIAAMRELGTSNVHWRQQFNVVAEFRIIDIVNRVHMQLAGNLPFQVNLNPNKCIACYLNTVCDRKQG